MMKIKLLALTALLTTSPVWADNELPIYQEESRAVAKSLMEQLKGELKKEISTNGPESAIKVCKEVAPVAAAALSNKNGWRITRVSLKPRNSLLGRPDAWEQKVLADFDQRAAKGEKADVMEYSEVVSEPAGKSYRYMKAMGVQPVCLTCHGASEAIPDGVKNRLAQEYPHDKATGYSEGQIRGAVSIKRPL